MGFASPRRIAITPAIVVVLTAPIPTSKRPSFPLAGATISSRRMAWFKSSPPGDPLAVTMAGVKMGDRLLVIGCSDPKLVAQLALKPGISGRVCAVDADAAAAA